MTGPPVPFSSLPLTATNPPTKLNAWGLYGPEDEVGFLNRQSDAIVSAAAASEVRSGHRISLDAPLDFQTSSHSFETKPLFSRQPFEKNVYQKKPRIVHDDTWSFNSQCATQWDGLRHYAYQSAARFYNNTTLEDIAGTSTKGRSNPHILGIHNQTKHGGIAGRGVLCDFQRWREGPGKSTVDAAIEGGFNSFQPHAIKLSWLLETLKHQGTELHYGDILVVRSGFFKSYYTLPSTRLSELAQQTPPQLAGVEQTDDVLEWIWNNFSAVASDHPSFERWPTPLEWSMHEVLLAGWGCPIGELFELEELSKHCEKEGRWTFFLVGVPTHVPGGAASPGNAVAFF